MTYTRNLTNPAPFATQGKIDVPRGQEDVKTKKHGEDDLPADFKKKLTEWEIRKALVGKSQQNVEELQKNLGEEFNRKMAEWERIKASASQQGQVKPGHPQVKTSASAGNLGGKGSALAGQMHVKPSPSASQVAKAPLIPGQGPASPRLDRKGSGHKIKKSKAAKTDKVPVVSYQNSFLWVSGQRYSVKCAKSINERAYIIISNQCLPTRARRKAATKPETRSCSGWRRSCTKSNARPRGWREKRKNSWREQPGRGHISFYNSLVGKAIIYSFV